jgi:hypothetical protein
MRLVYNSARRVLVWLGEEDPEQWRRAKNVLEEPIPVIESYKWMSSDRCERQSVCTFGVKF